jgi:ABC-type sugar transport system substrate-binding protein
MPKAATTLVALSLCVTASACGAGHGGVSKQPTDSIVAVIKGLDNSFFADMRNGLVATAAHQRAQLRVDAAADVNDAAGQAARFQADQSAAATCYIVSPINATNLIGSLAAIPSGTPIVNIDLPVAPQQAAALGAHVTTFIATDNVAAGRAAAKAMARFVPRGANVVVLTGPSGDANSNARVAGFTAGGRGHFRIVALAAADWDSGKARRATTDLLASNSKVRGIFAANDLMAIGSAAAVDAAGHRGHIAVIGVDGIRAALRAIKQGSLSATVAQSPYTMGRLGVEACLAAARGRKIPARIDAPLQLVTKGNLAQVEASFPNPSEHFADPLAELLNK